MVEGWFMMDEAELLRQLGAKLPRRADGSLAPPLLPSTGTEPGVLLERLQAAPVGSQEYRNKLVVLRALASAGAGRAEGRETRLTLQHLHDYGSARGLGGQTLASALPDMRWRVEALIAEGDEVWVRCNIEGTHIGPLYGIEPSGKRLGLHALLIARIADGALSETWYFGDELGLLLQLGKPDLLLATS